MNMLKRRSHKPSLPQRPSGAAEAPVPLRGGASVRREGRFSC